MLDLLNSSFLFYLSSSSLLILFYFLGKSLLIDSSFLLHDFQGHFLDSLHMVFMTPHPCFEMTLSPFICPMTLVIGFSFCIFFSQLGPACLQVPSSLVLLSLYRLEASHTYQAILRFLPILDFGPYSWSSAHGGFSHMPGDS